MTFFTVPLLTFNSACAHELHVRFATVEQGQKALATRDRFLRALSQFDLQSRLSAGGEPTVDALVDHLRGQVLSWSDAERENVAGIVEGIRQRLGQLPMNWPPEVLFIKSTGKDEGNAAYCRGCSVVLPQDYLARPRDELERIVAHELFHIYSNHNPERVGAMYRLVGFEPVAEIPLPTTLATRKITNPDAPFVNCIMSIGPAAADDNQDAADAPTRHVAPLLYANADFDPQKGATFFQYMTFRLMVVEKLGETWRPVEKDGAPELLDPTKTPEFQRRIGRNTRYILHPEEVLADNFVHLVFATPRLPNPEIVENMRRALAVRDTQPMK